MSKFAQTFDKFQIKYKYDEKKDALVECGKVDMQELADSNKDCALSEILKKFSDDEVANFMRNQSMLFSDDDLVDSRDMLDAVDELNDISNHLLDIKVKYGLPGDDLNDIVKAINSRKTDIENKINAFGGKLNESKKIEPQSEQEKLSSSSQGSQEKSKQEA